MLKGQKVVLRPVKRSDIPNFLKWFNDPEVIQYLTMYLPMTEMAEEKWIDEDDARALKVFEKHGNIMYNLTPAEWKEFQKLAPGVWAKFVAEYGGKSGYYLDKLKAAIAAAQ